MRDYGKLIQDLRDRSGIRQGGDDLLDEAAEAMSELWTIARRMTSLGADLEEQIKDDLTPDLYATSAETDCLTQLLDLNDMPEATIVELLPFKLKAMKVIGDSWFAFFPGDPAPREFLSEAAALQAIADYRAEQEK